MKPLRDNLLLAAFFLIQAAFASAQTSASLAQGDQLFAQGHYQGAIEAYRELAHKAPQDPVVLYNLGTAYARHGDVGRATWRYLQALQHAPRDPSLRHNLSIVDPAWKHDLAMTPIPPLNMLYWWLTANEWAALAVGGTTLAFLLMAALVWTRRDGFAHRFLKVAATLTVLVALLCWPPALLRHNQERLTWRGVVVEQTQAHIDPNPNASTTFDLHPGRVVRVLSQPAPGWLKISFAGDKVGFVERELVEFL